MILGFKGKYPKVDPTAFIAENTVVIGDVEIGAGSNIWFYSVVRGDQNYIRIGSNCSIQDACILHVEYELPLIIEGGQILSKNGITANAKEKWMTKD
jgi:carbonic anhydrase/acetyltransferase-like protein (isoleucine patch superfamily)